jgi:hypothetical protein
MVYLAFGNSSQTAGLICSTDQVFMLADGRLITAERLRVSGKLMDKNGDPVAIHTVAIGSFTGGIHHIGTGTKLTSDINGHLLLAGGVVAGDYALQLNFPNIPAQLKTEDFAVRPELGSQGYADAHGANKATLHMLFSNTGHATDGHIATQSGMFKVFAPAANFATEGAVVGLFTKDQEDELVDKVTQMPPSNPINRGMVNNLFCVFRGFFPDLWFYLDWYRPEPNVYAIERFGKKVVVVSGGLARTVGVKYEGMAMAIAHSVARLIGQGPKAMCGMTATGAADYQAFGMISREIWYGDHWLKFTLAGYQQLQPIFKLLTDTAGGIAGDPLNQPSIDCRLSAIESAIGGGDLPECAGGPKPRMIELQEVTATESGVSLTLSSAPTAETAMVVGNYAIDPVVTVEAAKVDERQDFVVNLAAKLKPGAYKMTIHGLTNFLGDGVDPNHNTLPFAVPR